MSNLKQIGLGFMQYTQDYDERLPPNEYLWGGSNLLNWDERIFPYVKSVQLFVCPSATGAQINAESTGASLTKQWSGSPDRDYAMNDWIARNAVTGGTPKLALAAIDRPSELFLAGDSLRSNMGGWYSSVFYARPDSDAITFGNSRVHLEGANYLYADGHVKWHKSEFASRRVNSGAPVDYPWWPGI